MRGGAYLLLIRLLTDARVHRFELTKGELVYLGSAVGGYGSRLLRHAVRQSGLPHPLFPALKRRFPGARGQKNTLFWHIDHLLELADARLEAALLFPGRRESELIGPLVKRGARPAALGFGSSDSNAPTHLFYCLHEKLQDFRGALWVR